MDTRLHVDAARGKNQQADAAHHLQRGDAQHPSCRLGRRVTVCRPLRGQGSGAVAAFRRAYPWPRHLTWPLWHVGVWRQVCQRPGYGSLRLYRAVVVREGAPSPRCPVGDSAAPSPRPAHADSIGRCQRQACGGLQSAALDPFGYRRALHGYLPEVIPSHRPAR